MMPNFGQSNCGKAMVNLQSEHGYNNQLGQIKIIVGFRFHSHVLYG
jgi:polysaccharide pyruvyl transferase WcaK-like protein